MKILHVVENLDKGAVENWLVNVFEHSRKFQPDWEWTFYCLLNRPGILDERVKSLGGKIIFASYSISHRILFLKSFRALLLKEKYDIIHAHHDFLSGFYLFSTIGIKDLKVINHIHNADEIIPVGNSFLKYFLRYPLATFAGIFADKTIAISKFTLEKFESKQLIRSKYSGVVYYGIKLENFTKSHEYNLRLELGISISTKILLFIGRLNQDKNPSFLLDIASKLIKHRSDFVLVFVGQGDQEKEIDFKAEFYNCNNLVYKLGWRNDVSQIMLDSDIFIFPRLKEPKEGLGLVVVEAQTAGLPILCTDGILDDAVVISELVFRLELDKVEDWVQTINSILNSPTIFEKSLAMTQMKNSSFEMEKATLNLLNLYEG